jgi:hypothetical protein
MHFFKEKVVIILVLLTVGNRTIYSKKLIISSITPLTEKVLDFIGDIVFFIKFGWQTKIQ